MSILVMVVVLWHSFQIYHDVLLFCFCIVIDVQYVILVINFFLINIVAGYTFYSSFCRRKIIRKCCHILINLQIRNFVLWYTTILIMLLLQIFQIKFSYFIFDFTTCPCTTYFLIFVFWFRCSLRWCISFELFLILEHVLNVFSITVISFVKLELSTESFIHLVTDVNISMIIITFMV